MAELRGLDARLADLGQHLAVPAVPDLAGAVLGDIRARVAQHAPSRDPSVLRRYALPVAVAAALVVGVVLAVPPTRRAVANWFGLGAVRIRTVEQLPPGVGTALRLGTEVRVAELDPSVRAPAGAGSPDRAYGGQPTPESVTLVWAPTDDLPEVDDTGVGLVLTTLTGSTNGSLVHKEVTPNTSIEPVSVDGQLGFWITGAPHTYGYTDARGEFSIDTTRLVTGNTLLWVDGEKTYRLESTLDLDGALALAEDLAPLG